MTRTMVAVSLIGHRSNERYDFMALPNKIGFCRVQTADRRTRWKRIYFNLANFPVDPESYVLGGPSLFEITEDEYNSIGATAAHPPRNVGLRAERVRKNSNGGGMHVTRLDSWLEEWRAADANSDNLWIGARTNRHGHAHQPLTVQTAEVPGTAPATATSAPVTATSGDTPEQLESASKPTFIYPAIVKGAVLRPNGEQYRVRKIGKKKDVEVLRSMRERGIHCLTTGVPGTGKSALMEAAFGSQMITVLGTEDLESSDLLGGYIESDSGHWSWVDGPLVEAMVSGLVLYLDEIGVVRAKQMSQLYSVMDKRDELLITANPKRGVVRAAPGFMVVASTNPESPEVRLTNAVMNRFGFKLQIETDYKMAAAQFGIPDWLIGASENMELRRKSRELAWSPQFRDLILWKENVEVLGSELDASGVMINSAPAPARGTVGEVLSKALGKKVHPLVLS